MDQIAHTADTDIATFKKMAQDYKVLIDADITDYSKRIQKETLQEYGINARTEIDAFLSVLERGGKRIRGSLVMLGYEMSGGTDKAMILQAARAVEMMHAYILIIDDIQDHSNTRRGGPAAHALLANYHREHELAGDSPHFGLSIALNAALSGVHAAQALLTELDVDDNLRLQVVNIINRTMLTTAHGQTNDIFNEVVAEVSAEDIERVLEWKTAHYTFLNPLRVGMVLAGADSVATEAITEYAMHAGKAFQITDDIMGIFGNEFESGKSPMDDIREGKRTVLTLHALQHATNGNKNFMIQMLGNTQLTPAEFQRCKDILIETGALEYAREQAIAHIEKAVQSLNREIDWSESGMQFLRGLAQYLVQRQS